MSDKDKHRKQVMLKPASRVERALRVRFNAAGTLWDNARNADIQRELQAIVANGQSWRQKLGRMKATILLGATEELHSDRSLDRLGMRIVDCTCPAKRGHNAPRRIKKERNR